MSKNLFDHRDSRARSLSGGLDPVSWTPEHLCSMKLVRFRGPPRTFLFKVPTMEAQITLHYLALGRHGLVNPRGTRSPRRSRGQGLWRGPSNHARRSRSMRAKLLAVKIEFAQKDARPHRKNRCLGEADAKRASELFRSLGQPPELVVVLQQTEAAVACVAQAAQSNSTPQLGEVHQTRSSLLSANQDTPPLALHRFDARTRGRSPVR
jgi:hypothetical protein